ncbi:(-)-alpha-terpineol synthase-like [Dendrobium catenatum]|uniref:(-)-alpha-terpineol synthase-like n=1 Tax=Dendrobium catenatum TaxID=906689 RepID=UPI00109FF481|nr:(-)-alpha-terpineol synthase-like [Dendrobium catenatum]
MEPRSSFEDEIPNQIFARRSANYQPSSWDYTSLHTLSNTLKEEVNDRLAEELMQEVRNQINDGIKLQRQLELIEAIDRLGLASLFHEEIYQVLSVLSLNNYKEVILCGLRSTAICFQLLRRFGFQISEGIFDDFMDGDHNTFLPTLSDDLIGLLSLYNASYMAFPGEKKMESARSFALKNMTRKNMQEILPGSIESAIGHALDLPLHRRMPWMEARMYIDMYELEDGMSPALLHLAKIHFNKVQSIHQKELKHAGSWWTRLDLGKTISFSRDRLMECFFYVVGIVHHPDYGFCREKLTQVGMLIATIDDVYDVYGSLEELELFTQIIDRWDIKGVVELPYYMKICFSALNDTINGVANHLYADDRLEAIPYIKRVWADLFKSFLVEAKWHKKGYIPTLKEYLSNASISAAGHVILFLAYILLKCKITKETLQLLQDFPNIIRLPSLIFRLCNDLATSSVEQERGDVATSVQCYMKETGASEEEARLYISMLISDAWNDMNEEYSTCSKPQFPQRFIDASINLARMASFMYQHGDGFSAPSHQIKGSIKSLLLNSISNNLNERDMQ